MKKILILLAVMGAILVSCKKEKIGGTATQKIAGEWVITTIDYLEADGSVWDTEEEASFFATYNTAANVSTEMWLDNIGHDFWAYSFKAVVNLDYEKGTFSTNDYVENHGVDPNPVKVTNGKILYGAATTPSGMPADSITFEFSIQGDIYAAYYGYTTYRVSGYRYTGFVADEPH